MIRIVIENVVLFLLPTAIYFTYRYIAMGDDRTAAGAMSEAPLFGLFAAGALVVIAVLMLFSQETGGKPGQKYQPPVFKDGRIQPGRIE
jgi:hypothetical protein